MGLNKMKLKERLSNVNNHSYKFIFILFILLLASIPFILFEDRDTFTSKATSYWKNFPITADSLITGATITLIVFTNFAPNGSSGSTSIIRRTYWRTTKVSNSLSTTHKLMWNITLSWLKPSYIIVLTLLTTFAEVFILYFQISIWALYGLIIITSMLLFTALTRFVLFHLYANKNVATYLHQQYIKLLKTKKNKFSIFYDFLSFFRMTSNFELLYIIMRKFKTEPKIRDEMKEYVESKEWNKLNQENMIHPWNKLNENEFEDLFYLSKKDKNIKKYQIFRNLKQKNIIKKEYGTKVARSFVVLFVFNVFTNDKIKKNTGKFTLIMKYITDLFDSKEIVNVIKNAAFAFGISKEEISTENIVKNTTQNEQVTPNKIKGVIKKTKK